jgi:hypothetical protein
MYSHQSLRCRSKQRQFRSTTSALVLPCYVAILPLPQDYSALAVSQMSSAYQYTVAAVVRTTAADVKVIQRLTGSIF